MTDSYCVFGNPIGHSKSPVIHSAFARQTGQDISYTARLAPQDGFAASVKDFIAAGGRGANVTIPFKEEAFRLADRLTPLELSDLPPTPEHLRTLTRPTRKGKDPGKDVGKPKE